MFKCFRFLSLVALLGGLAACASFNRVELDPAATAVQLTQRSLSDPGLLGFVQSVLGTDFSTEQPLWSVDALTVAALYYNGDIQLAKAQQETAKAAVITAKQRPNPNLSNSLTYVTNRELTSAPWIVANALNIPVETAHKRTYRVERAQWMTNAAAFKVTEAIWGMRSRLQNALLEQFAAQQALRLFEAQAHIQAQLYERLEQQAVAGELAWIEVIRAGLQRNQAQLELEAAQKRLAESHVALAAVIGIPAQGLPVGVLQTEAWTAPPDLTTLPVAQLRNVALHSRSDILAALAEYEAAQAALQLEIANQYPNIMTSPGYTWDLGAHFWVLGTGLLQLPVFHQNQGAIAEAEARRKEMAQRIMSLQMKVLADIDRASAGTLAIQHKWQTLERQMQLQQEYMHEVTASYDSGEIDQIAVLQARLAYLALQRAQLEVLVESHQNAHSLEDALRQPMRSILAANLHSRATP